MEPQISVIMPVYNQEKYLAETIESVLSQSFKDFEFIILDDGSTDSSASIIQEYTEKDTRIIPFFEANAGKSAATNKIAKKAKGKWLAFLDADDAMLPCRLEKQIAFHLANPEINASSCHCYYINDKGKMLGKQRYPGLRTAEACKQALANNKNIMCSFTGLMTTRESFMNVGGLRTEMTPCEDLDLFNRLVEKGYLLVIIPEVLMKYRLHSSAVTTRNPMHMYNLMRYASHCIKLRRAGQPEIKLNEYLDLIQQDTWSVKFKRAKITYSQIFFRRAGNALIYKNYGSFFFYISMASLISPSLVYYKVNNLLSKKI